MILSQDCGLALLLCFFINTVMSQENDLGRRMPFPDNEGNPVDVPIHCRHKRETVRDLAAHVRFHLYRRLKDDRVAQIQMKINETLPGIILRREPTKILIHGFINSLQAEMIQKIKDAYLDAGQRRSQQTNVIAVDWGDLAGLSLDCYVGPMRRTLDVGRYLASFVDFLVEQGAVDLGSLHLIGHSLGAHVAGIAGQLTHGQVARITGLDPAGVLYGSQGLDSKLDKSDAMFVDVIHTDTQLLGFKAPCGHIDFYPHGGGYQPGCVLPTCSHSRAHAYFRESILRWTDYSAYECDSLDDVTGCYAFEISGDDGCRGCNTNSSNFMGQFATIVQADTLYFSHPPVPGSEGGSPSAWGLWSFPLMGVAGFCGGAVVTGTAMWGWRKYWRHAGS